MIRTEDNPLHIDYSDYEERHERRNPIRAVFFIANREIDRAITGNREDRNMKDPKSITALIVSIVAAINAICAIFGWQPLGLDESTIYTVVSAVLMVASWVYSIWHNFNFTRAAQAGQLVTDTIKAGEESVEDSALDA